MSGALDKFNTCPTEGCVSTTACRLFELIEKFEDILPESDQSATDAEVRLHEELFRTCLRYQDAVALSALDDIR